MGNGNPRNGNTGTQVQRVSAIYVYVCVYYVYGPAVCQSRVEKSHKTGSGMAQ